MGKKGACVLGYRKYAKDYEIEYTERIGGKGTRANRIYVGPYFSFSESKEKLRRMRRLYLLCIVIAALLLLIPMCIDCAFTRTWYVQLPSAIEWIAWVLAAGAVWRLWTAGEKVEREHYDLMYGRMSGACVFMIILSLISSIGCVAALVKLGGTGRDYAVFACCVLSFICSVLMFSQRKALRMHEVENPEKPQAGKNNS